MVRAPKLDQTAGGWPARLTGVKPNSEPGVKRGSRRFRAPVRALKHSSGVRVQAGIQRLRPGECSVAWEDVSGSSLEPEARQRSVSGSEHDGEEWARGA